MTAVLRQMKVKLVVHAQHSPVKLQSQAGMPATLGRVLAIPTP